MTSKLLQYSEYFFHNVPKMKLINWAEPIYHFEMTLKLLQKGDYFFTIFPEMELINWAESIYHFLDDFKSVTIRRLFSSQYSLDGLINQLG